MMEYPKIPRDKDLRIKLTSEDRQEIRRLRQQEGLSQRALAARFGISRRTIQFILDPLKLEENVLRRKERIARGEQVQYYKGRSHLYMRKHRAHKKLVNGEEYVYYLKEQKRKYDKNNKD